MQTEYKIYALCCPVTENIRYIGYTSQPLEKRLRLHINSSKIGDHETHRGKWIQSLLKQGLRPLIKLIESVVGDVKEREVELIAYYKTFCTLVNGTSGGDGSKGHKMSEEARKRRSQQLLGVRRADYCKRVLLHNTKDNTFIPCPSVFDAARWLNCSPESIRDAARKIRVKTIFDHTVDYC